MAASVHPARADRAAARAPELALALVCVVALAVVLHAGRGLTFFYDEWDFILHRRGISLTTFLAPHGGDHPSILPVAIYKTMLQIFGLGSYLPYRLLVALLHVACGVLLYVYARRRVGAWLALVPAALLLFLGSAWQDIVWAFQIGFLLSLVSGLATLLVLDARTRRDWLACLLLVVSFTSSALGLAFVVVAGVEIVIRRQWARIWLVAVPIAVLAVLYAGWGGNGPERQLADPAHAVRYALDMAAAGVGGLAGLGLDWGRPLLVAAAVVVGAAAIVRPTEAIRAAGLAAGALALLLLTGLSRAEFQPPVPPETSRYIYPTALMLLLLSVSVLGGRSFGRRPLLIACIGFVTALACVSGAGVLGDGASGLRSVSQTLLPELSALEAARGSVDPSFAPDPERAPPVTARSYFEAIDAFGSPAPSLAEIRRGGPAAQATFDAALARALGLAPVQQASAPATGAAPPVESAAGGRTAPDGKCLRFESSGSGAALDLAVAPGRGLTVHAQPGPPVEVRARRLANEFSPAVTIGAIAGGTDATLAVKRDSLDVPWHVRLSPRQALRVCSIDG
ncbi:MAG TPA: hypothetical protein VNS09_12565 [Solirubrobacter sp.]|nr:hypothetical protein [Solirubrobacter sp.]